MATDPAHRAPLSAALAPLATPARRAFDELREAGWRFVQLSDADLGLGLLGLGATGRRDLLATLRRREMAISGIDAWMPEARLADPSGLDQALATLLATIRIAADLGRVAVSLRLPTTPDETAAPVRAALIAEAERYGVALADHVVPPCDDAGVRVGIDPAAWLAAGRDPVEAIALHGTRLGSARLCDLLATGDRGPVGRGPDNRLDLEAYRLALTLGAREQPVVVDARGWADPRAGLVASRRAWEM